MRRSTRTYYVDARPELLFILPRRWSGRIVEAEVGLVHGDPCLLLDLEVGECLRLRGRTGPPLEVTVERLEVRARGRRAQVELACAAPRPPYRW